MAARDCAFLLSFAAGFIGFMTFMLTFVKPEWTEYKNGFAGLWSECSVNRSLEPEDQVDCHQTAKADGPVFLEIVRTLLILALVCEIMGVFGYNMCQPQTGQAGSVKIFKERLQEISYFLAGTFIIIGVIIYGLNYHDYYTETKEFTSVQFRWAFYLMAITGGVNLMSSIVMTCTKYSDYPNEKHATSEAADIKTEDVKKIEPREEVKPVDEKDTEKDGDVNDQIVVKTSAMKRIATPTNIILAFNRIKSGVADRRKKGDKDTDQKCPIIPPPSEIRLFTPTLRKVESCEGRSLSSCSSSDEETLRSAKNANNNNIHRQKVKRSVTTLKDSTDSKPWAIDLEDEDNLTEKNKPRRHLSHDAIKQPQQVTQPNRLAIIPDKGIYTIPTETEHPDLVTPPRYEEVIGSHPINGEIPRPIHTDQSKIFQPYSKK